MAEVAVRAGVSTQTVSRVANQHENVSPAARVKVLAAMRALGYRPKLAARALVTGRFGALGVVRSDDVPGARFFDPPLTTVHQDFDVVGRRSVTLLWDRMEHLDRAPCRRVGNPPS
jgi:DNA-binding LacI/PurR family transcriptional regulator